jgi:hypothetical protein
VAEVDHTRGSLDTDPQALQPLIEDPLSLVLRQDEHERIRRVQPAESHLCLARRAGVHRQSVDAMAQLEEFLDDAELVEDLERPRVDPDRPGLPRPRGLLIEDAHLDSAPGQLDREHHPGRSGTDNHDGHVILI